MKVAKNYYTDTNNCPFYVHENGEGMKEAILWHLERSLGCARESATTHSWWVATALAVKNHIMSRFINTMYEQHKNDARRIHYFSLEYLVGRLTTDVLVNTNLMEPTCKALRELGLDPDVIFDAEVDMGLGNGGLGRLAACFQDSLATLNYPAIGYGIRYEFGLFTQSFEDGKQVESPDNWLRYGCPWEIVRPEYTVRVRMGGRVVNKMTDKGDWLPSWEDTKELVGVPWDIPVVGFGAKTVNFLRLWESRASNEFDLGAFNEGGYAQAVHEKAMSETISKVLYPNDKTENGKILRLLQQYFFVSCSLQDILRRYRRTNDGWDALPDKVFIHLNDTHPALVIPELMRILIDVEGLEWSKAWDLTRRSTGYTNHTILQEALEKWPVPMMERLLPRHLQIIYEINGRFLQQVSSLCPGDVAKLQRMSLIDENGERYVRMANLCVVGSSSVNGVAELHTKILREQLFRDFCDIWPEKFRNVTNGITPRRWLLKANPALAQLITDSIGDGWITDLSRLRELERFSGDAGFLSSLSRIKKANKDLLANWTADKLGIKLNTDAIFDVQVKRLHEYKRQLLLALYIVIFYNRLLHDPSLDPAPRQFIFAAKAAPGYYMAKLIIRFIHGIAEVVNSNPKTRDRLSVAFLPDYRVSLAEKIMPAAEVSEQISLAGMEASGTGNMKFMMNGALTLGTFDGANVEISQEVGEENMFIFGMRAEEVAQRRAAYVSRDYYKNDPEIRQALDMIKANAFSVLEPGLFDPILRNLLDYNDYYMLLADLRDYSRAQDLVDATYRDAGKWNAMSLVNIARSGRFSSDRAVMEYAKNIWHISPVKL